MKTRQRCICSGRLRRKAFSANFDTMYCEECNSHHFVSVEGGLSTEFRYDGGTRKYSQRDYLYGKQLRWAHSELLRKDWTGRKVLEIGCFNGFFLHELRAKGADVYGFDVNSDALAVGRELFGLDGRLHHSIASLAEHGPFDDVLCIDVVEHLDEPEALLSEVSALLKPGGRVVVAGPTIERRFHDKSDYPPHHKWWFSRKGLREYLRLGGYEVADTLVQRDGMLLLRNFIGKVLGGAHKKEFHGAVAAPAPTHNGPLASRVYAALSLLGRALFTVLGISYCSTILIATRTEAA